METHRNMRKDLVTHQRLDPPDRGDGSAYDVSSMDSINTGGATIGSDLIHPGVPDVVRSTVGTGTSIDERDFPRPIQVHEAQPMTSSLVGLHASACERLIHRAFSPHEVISLIEAVFTSKREIQMVRDLRGDAAQVFIDVVHEARLYNP